jgi:amidase
VTEPFGNMGVKGPLARTVGDIALLMSVMGGPDANDPASYPSDPQIFEAARARTKGIRVAWCPDLGGLPLEPEVRAVLDAQRATLERLGCIVEDVHPDLTGADEAFLTLRAWHSWSNLGALLDRHRGEMKQEAITEIENGAKFSGGDIARAMTLQTQVMASMMNFQRNYEYVLCAVNQVRPFDAKITWPHEIAGTNMEHYIAWMKSAYWITVTGCPAISVPAGFTTDGLPVGLQIVGRYRADFELLQFAHMFEQATHAGRRRPELRTAS